ncbi:MAG: DUF4920 domain-containing protein [Flavobacteriia bacterium]|nr:DUF4920 domain-containing protein [Flavobacteriia bacterium]
MKKVFLLLFTVSLLAACGEKKSEEVKAEMSHFGPAKVQMDKAITVEEMLKQMESSKDEKYFTFEGTIDEVCSKAGCWVNVKKPDGSTFMIRFKDHFTIPTKTPVGTKAYFSGNAYWDTIPVDMLKHFAEDAGKTQEEIDQITESKFELAFEADGIMFEKTKKK